MVLANRNETIAIPEIIKLAKDERSMVRACAIGALGHLKAKVAKDVFFKFALGFKFRSKKEFSKSNN